MEKHLKDYLYLYYGCKVKTKQGIGEWFFQNDWNNRIKVYYEGDEENSYYYLYSEIKPLLRPLSDVTEDEWSEIEYKSDIATDAWGYNGLRDNFIKGTSEYRFHWTIVSWAINELRKIGVDMDGLIEAKLAINNTKLTAAMEVVNNGILTKPKRK